MKLLRDDRKDQLLALNQLRFEKQDVEAAEIRRMQKLRSDAASARVRLRVAMKAAELVQVRGRLGLGCSIDVFIHPSTRA